MNLPNSLSSAGTPSNWSKSRPWRTRAGAAQRLPMEALKQILDFGKPLNIAILDQAVNAFFQGNMELQPILVQFQEHPQAWTRVDAILDKSQSPHCKMLGLNILDRTIKYRWGMLPQQQRVGIRQFIVALIIKLSQNKESLQKNTAFVTKLNIVLVQVCCFSF